MDRPRRTTVSSVTFQIILGSLAASVVPQSASAATWLAPVRVDNSNLAAGPLLAVDQNGNAIVGWIESNANGVNSIWSSRSTTTGTTWTPQVVASVGDSNSIEPLRWGLAIDGRGNAVAVWKDGTVDRVYANRFPLGDTWGTAAPIESHSSTSDGRVYSVAVACDPNGNATAVWGTVASASGVLFPHRTIWANTYTFGQSWGPTAARISPADNSTNDPNSSEGTLTPSEAVAMDRNGNALAVFTQFTGNAVFGPSTLVWNFSAAHYTPTGGWETVQRVNGESSGVDLFSSLAQVAMDPNGNAFAIFSQRSRTRVARWTAALGWEFPNVMQSDSINSASVSPQIAVAANGDAMLVWQQNNTVSNTVGIWASHHAAAASGWEPAKLIETDPGAVGSPAVAMDANGNAIAVWAQSNGTTTTIHQNRYTAGTGWGTATPISNPALNAGSPRISFDGAGRAIAVWGSSDPVAGGAQVLAARFLP